ncbi:MAG: hypothetical protein RMJ87_04205 [Cytophagales bacterium]|nr:hypothetical protein [Bernardetiaceae bacterium]MDW8204212.1 hypothetical protein [Cytophagales bacterium]
MCLSCFEIREEITISKQGSGNYVFLLDMSRSKSLIDMAMSMQMAKDRTSFAQIDSAFAKGTERLAQIQGIQNVQAINDHEQYVFGMRFDFQHIEALNAALNQSQEQAELNGTNIFTFKKKELSRTERTPISALADLAVLRSTPEGAAQMQTLLQGAAYVCVVRPQTGKIRSFSNPNGELQDNNKTFYYRVPLLDIMEGRTSPANTIKFKF